jgi:hypothetical protein
MSRAALSKGKEGPRRLMTARAQNQKIIRDPSISRFAVFRKGSEEGSRCSKRVSSNS